jgi:hypothetical protein
MTSHLINDHRRPEQSFVLSYHKLVATELWDRAS